MSIAISRSCAPAVIHVHVLVAQLVQTLLNHGVGDAFDLVGIAAVEETYNTHQATIITKYATVITRR